MRNNVYLNTGKLELDFLNELLKKYSIDDPSVVVGPGIGNDAAVIDLGDTYLIAKTDPITFIAQDIGFYAVNINANDIACMGGVPRWFLTTILLPENNTTQQNVEDIFQQITSACKKFDITLCGGHTEVTYGIDRPIVIGQMLGTVPKDGLVKPSNAQPGDDVFVTKGIAIEATSIIAREKARELSSLFSSDFVERSQNFIRNPGISVLQDSKIALSTGPVHAMHDPTEGGIATGLYELAYAADVGLSIALDKIPIIPEAKLLCDQYGIDILGVIASGALLFVMPPIYSQAVLSAFERKNIIAANIGKVVSKEQGVKLKMGNEEMDLPIFPQDEIIKIFE